MPAHIFLSCSQTKETIEANVVDRLESKIYSELGIKVHVAIRENHFNGNLHLLGNLKECDYFLFIDFKRDVSNPQKESYFSQYTHQELAMAFALGFDKTNMLIFHQRQMNIGGMLGNMFINEEFDGYSDVVDKVVAAVKREKWTSNYSRKIVPLSWHLNDKIDDWRDKYSRPREGEKLCSQQQMCMDKEFRHELIALVTLQNRRKDIAALNCIVHLKNIKGTHDFLDRSPIKAAGINGYSHTIWPDEKVEFDLFGYDVDKKMIFMHTECDITDKTGCRKPLIKEAGDYTLIYEIYAEHFPVSTFEVHLKLGAQYPFGILFENSILPMQLEHSSSSSGISAFHNEALRENFKKNSLPLEAPGGTGFASSSDAYPENIVKRENER